MIGSRMSWFGHVKSKESEYIGRRMLRSFHAGDLDVEDMKHAYLTVALKLWLKY